VGAVDVGIGQGVVGGLEQVGEVLLVADDVINRTGEVGVGGADVDVAPVARWRGPHDAVVRRRSQKYGCAQGRPDSSDIRSMKSLME
jgi:hypothetical protein